jgi:omega-hydroxy-beta-dihydromenaquinone-9 sulfotransferase
MNSLDTTRLKIRLPWRTIPLLALPRFLSGFRMGDWLRLLRAHGYRVDPPFWPRALLATVGAGVTSILARFEEPLARGHVDASLWERPVFILGLPRSGTSHLFELLSECPSICFPTRFDAFNPHTFLLLRRTGLFAVLAKLPKFKRAMDNLRCGWDSPEEDIVALSILTSTGERIRRAFSRDSSSASDSVKLEPLNSEENMEIILAMRAFSRKLVMLHSKRVLFKSPGHIARVKEILQIFPEAKFITIFRNPLHQAASLQAMSQSGNPFWCSLQWPCAIDHKSVFESCESRLCNYFNARASIPSGNLVEITFEQLVSDRTGTIQNICRAFNLELPPSKEKLEATARNARPPNLPPAFLIPLIREHYKLLYTAELYPRP